MVDYTIWFGPVFEGQVRDAVLGGSKLRVVQVKNNATAQPYLARWRNAAGDYIPGMLKDLKIDTTTLGSLFIGSFSAGHNLAKQVTRSVADRSMIRGLVLADSEQSGWADAKHVKAVIPPGYLDFARDAATSDDKLFVSTAGTGTSSEYAPSSATMHDIVEKLRSEGLSIQDGSDLVPSTFEPKPSSIAGAKGFASLDYQGRIGHEDHVLKLAPLVWQQIVTPWYSRLPQGGVAFVPVNYNPATPGADEPDEGGEPLSSQPQEASAMSGATKFALLTGGALVAYALLSKKRSRTL